MAKLNITQAAHAVGKHRSTLQRHIKDGTLSAEKDAADNPLLDVSELQRVYGHVENPTDAAASQSTVMRQFDMPHSATKIELLEVKLAAAERERNEAVRREQEEKERHRETRENRDRLLGVVEEQSKTIAALPAVSAVSNNTSTTEATVKRGLWKRLFG